MIFTNDCLRFANIGTQLDCFLWSIAVCITRIVQAKYMCLCLLTVLLPVE